MAAVRDHLLTPVGLRTLPTDDPAYHPHYRGNAMARDGAYHRGTLWPWLMGSYAEAVLRAGTFSDAARKEAHTALAGLHEHLNGRGFGQIHEIFEAKPGPNGVHAPRGCPAQAWSIAELIRANVLLNENASPKASVKSIRFRLDHAGSIKSMSPQSGTSPASTAAFKKVRTASRPRSP